MKAVASEFRFQVESDAPSVPYHLVDKDGKARDGDLSPKWPFLVGGLEHDFSEFPYIGNNKAQLTNMCQRGRYSTNQI